MTSKIRNTHWFIALWAMQGLLWGMTADELTRQTGIAGGFCSFPQATQEDVKLALELAQRPTFVVHVMAREEDQVARIRKAADAAGVLGRTFYVEQGSAAALPFANRLVDLMVISNIGDSSLTTELRSECLRVLSPGHGLARIGCAKETGSRVSKEKLATWAGNRLSTKVLEDASGLWVALRADLPSGSDDWSHRFHGAEGSQTSMDTTLQAPFLTQWWGLPRGEGMWGTTVVASHGRMYSAREPWKGHDLWSKDSTASLTVRSLNNGIVLWQRTLGQRSVKEIPNGGYLTGRSCMVAMEDSLFLIDHDGVLRLDAETGAVRNRFAGPKPDGQVKWIALQGNLLAVLSGDADNINAHRCIGTAAENPFGRELAVYDIQANQALWHETVAGDIGERLIVLHDQSLYCLVQGVGVVGRDLKSGKVLWTNPDASLQADFDESKKAISDPKTGGVVPVEFGVLRQMMSAYPEVLLLRSEWKADIAVLSRKDGSVLWKKLQGPLPGGVRGCVWGDTWLSFGNKPLNLLTGKETNGPYFPRSGCGVTIGTPNYLITCFGRISDAKSDKPVRTEDLKAPCDVGSIVAEGLVLGISGECACHFEIKGYRALASAGDVKPTPPYKERLKVLDTTEPAPLNIGAADWPTYRHDAQRSGATTAMVGEQPGKIIWQWKPSGAVPYAQPYAFAEGADLKPDFLATAPVAADGLVWFGSHDGTIRCVKADSGKEVWTFATGGMIFGSPTVWQGRLLVGSCDGRVYCLDARTGKCLWRLLAAPSDRRVFWYGHLINTWPVLSGVAVQNGIAYTAAGFQAANGSHTYALDPKNGQEFWEKVSTNVSFGGGMALAEDKMWLPSGINMDLKNGELNGLNNDFGSEVGVFDKRVIWGGRRPSETEVTINRPLKANGFYMFDPQNSKPWNSRIILSEVGISLPAWDAEHILLPPQNAVGELALVSRAQFPAWLTEYPAIRAAYDKAPNDPKLKPTARPALKQWATDTILPAAFALAKDQAVIAYISEGHYKLSGYLRGDGKKAWTIDLPEQPAMNRLALDREGRVLISLCDGSVVCVGK